MKNAIRLASIWYFRAEARALPPTGGFLKRVFDIVGALGGLLLLGPLFLMVALLIRLTDGGAVFYRHTRIGHNGNEFKCLKFRTMVLDGDSVLEDHLRRNPAQRREWMETRKLKSDPRVTRVGGVLRKLSIDELPQLINILTGDMSIVGPRPVVDDELSYYGRAAQFYLRSRPGLTGLWQISGRNDTSYQSRVAFDRQYVENWSLGQDVLIIVKTVPAVCAQRGSY